MVTRKIKTKEIQLRRMNHLLKGLLILSYLLLFKQLKSAAKLYKLLEPSSKFKGFFPDFYQPQSEQILA